MSTTGSTEIFYPQLPQWTGVEELRVCVIPPPPDNTGGVNNKTVNNNNRIDDEPSVCVRPTAIAAPPLPETTPSSKTSESRRSSIICGNSHSSDQVYVERRRRLTMEANSKNEHFRSSMGNLFDSFQEYKRFSSYEKNVNSHLSPSWTTNATAKQHNNSVVGGGGNSHYNVNKLFEQFKRKSFQADNVDVDVELSSLLTSSFNTTAPFPVRRGSVNINNLGRPVAGAGAAVPLTGMYGRRFTLLESGGKLNHPLSNLKENHYRRRGSALPMATPFAGEMLLDASAGGSRASLRRLKNSSLSQSCPNLHLLTLNSSSGTQNKKKELGMQRKRSHIISPNCRTTSPPVPSRCHSPSCPGGGGGGSPAESARTSPNPYQMANHLPHIRSRLHNMDARRWSVASLPTSGYGTPGSSNLSSQFSSDEQLPDHQFGASGEFHSLGYNDAGTSGLPSPKVRLRARSLSGGSVSTKSTGEVEIAMRNNIYKERFPKAKAQMEDYLEKFISSNSRQLSASFESDRSQSPGGAGGGDGQQVMQILSDGSARFVYHQILELASDCLQKSQDDLISSSYFYDFSQNLDELLQEAKEKSPNSVGHLTNLARKLLLIVSRPARLLECLEFDADEFYRFLEEAECRAKEMQDVGGGLPQYILQKLGLHKDNLDSPASSNTDDAETKNRLTDEENDRSSSGKIVSPKNETRKSSADFEVETIRKRPPKEEDFDSVKLISNGAYGSVHLVKHVETGNRYALKKLKKFNLALRNQIDQVYAERDILTFTDNPFVVSFYGSFETKRHLCMVLEYVKGGDCASLLKQIGVFPVEMARMYIAETILAIEYLHSYGVVHRDLKPDNLLITAFGHIKLTDFGLSKIGLMNRTNLMYEGCLDFSETHHFQDRQICGTPEYIAPEVILRLGYGKPVDWWAVGIIMYEFLVGVAPFMGDSPEELFSHIITDDIQWPEEPYAPPEDAQDLTLRLLSKNPLDRLGTVNGAFEIKVHEFFSKLDWNCLLRRKAEFVPDLENEDDTSYFDSRADRYCHDIESDEEDFDTNSPMFSSFSSCSPRFNSFVEGNRPPTKVGSDAVVNLLSQTKDGLTPIEQSSLLKSETKLCPIVTNDKPVVSPRQLKKVGATKSSESYPDTTKLSSTRITVQHETETGQTVTSSSVAASDKVRLGVCRSRQLSVPCSSLLKAQNLHVVIPASPSLSPKDNSPLQPSPVSSSDISPLINQLKPPIFIRKGPKGFGFTIRAIKVYLGQSEYYTIQHLVTVVDNHNPAFEAGLRPDDLITHVNGESVQNLTHPEVVQRMLGGGDVLTLKVCPLTDTSIRQGESRKSVGKLIRKKLSAGSKKVGQQRAGVLCEKKSRKPSSFRRLTGGRRGSELKILGTAPAAFQRSYSTSESISSNESGVDVLLKRHSTVQAGSSGYYPPTTPRKGGSSSSANSSPASSLSETGAVAGLFQSRPSSLHGLKHKLYQTLCSNNNKRKQTPVVASGGGSTTTTNSAGLLSPLARGGGSGSDSSSIPPRSPSPLAAGCENFYAAENRRRSVGVQKTITKPRKSEADDNGPA